MLPFERSFASHPKSKFWSSKNIMKPEELYKGSTKKIIFNCNLCNHEFSSVLYSISSANTWCPYCSNQKLCENKDCKYCFEKSFASHTKSELWSDKNILQPIQVFKNSNNKYHINCNKCNHTYHLYLNNIDKNGCVFCAGQKLCENKDCKDCLDKSFASSDKSKFWSKKNKLSPRDIFIQSNKKYIFDCNECNHDFKISLNKIYGNKWCSYCSHHKLCDNSECLNCFEKSFASSDKSKYWSNKNKLSPRNVFKSTSKKYIFNCNKCNNEFMKQLYQITNMNSWCPICRHKTELKLFDWLKDNNDNKVKTQILFTWSQNKRYDFILEELKLIIELDGAQHFEQVSNWQSPEKIQENDNLKNKLALKNGYRMIRICQRIVWNNKEDWGNQLTNAINNQDKYIEIGNIYHNLV
jgi:very-short-patch-repair endonuclease